MVAITQPPPPETQSRRIEPAGVWQSQMCGDSAGGRLEKKRVGVLTTREERVALARESRM